MGTKFVFESNVTVRITMSTPARPPALMVLNSTNA